METAYVLKYLLWKILKATSIFTLYFPSFFHSLKIGGKYFGENGGNMFFGGSTIHIQVPYVYIYYVNPLMFEVGWLSWYKKKQFFGIGTILDDFGYSLVKYVLVLILHRHRYRYRYRYRYRQHAYAYVYIYIYIYYCTVVSLSISGSSLQSVTRPVC